ADNLKRIVTLFPRLAERMDQLASTMSGGERQMVAIGRALMSSPDILLLDEPSLGLAPLVCSELFQALGRIRELGVGVLLVEQNARAALAIADRGYLLENGRIVGEGSAKELRNDPAVHRAYLGGGAPANGADAAGRPFLGNGRVRAQAAEPVRAQVGNGSLAAAAPTPGSRGEGRGEGQPHTPTSAQDPAPHPSPLPARTAGEARSAMRGERELPAADPVPSNQASPGSEAMIAVDLMINNADVKAAGNATFERLNPLTGEVAARAAASSAE